MRDWNPLLPGTAEEYDFLRPLLKRRRLRDLDDRQPDTPTLEFRGVTTGYGKVAVLTDLNLRIMPGDFLGLIVLQPQIV